jgi:hypothetical protein
MENLFDKVKEDALMSMVETALPKIQPFLKPAAEKMNEWFGDDDKLIVIKKNKGQPVRVIIFDNKKGDFEISKSGEKNTFTADKECIIGVYDVEAFATKLISGEFTKSEK